MALLYYMQSEASGQLFLLSSVLTIGSLEKEIRSTYEVITPDDIVNDESVCTEMQLL